MKLFWTTVWLWRFDICCEASMRNERGDYGDLYDESNEAPTVSNSTFPCQSAQLVELSNYYSLHSYWCMITAIMKRWLWLSSRLVALDMRKSSRASRSPRKLRLQKLCSSEKLTSSKVQFSVWCEWTKFIPKLSDVFEKLSAMLVNLSSLE